ncbi:MAG TPA: DUF1579 domain-containing protein [Chitinophagaceae bacterium]|nr:DUF1579 domain-containing protein [Chitinophagaceae bacterium]
MKKILLTALTAILTFGAFAQSEADMQKWMAHATPGDMHKMLANYNGRWTANTKMWMDPSQPPMESTADVTTDMHMGDRYQKSVYSGDFGGMPFQGESLTGYDNTRKVFTNTWIDNMGTGIMYSEGTWNEKTRSVEFKGTATDPMAGKAMPFREVFTFSGNDNYKMEMYNMVDGREYKTMEISFTRKK